MNLVGRLVTAKRLGYDGTQDGTPEDDFDPFEGDTDLEGPLEIQEVLAWTMGETAFPAGVIYLVGGQLADPDTIVERHDDATPAN